MKKLWLSTACIASVITPVVAVVSCANKNQINNTPKSTLRVMSVDHLRDFNDISADGTVWSKGVAYHSYSQGTSFLFNLAEKLGWTKTPDTSAAETPAPLAVLLDKLHPTQVAQPINNYVIDPVGTDGTLNPYRVKPLGFDVPAAFGEGKGDGYFGSDDGIQVRNFSTYIDANSHDGSVIVKFWTSMWKPSTPPHEDGKIKAIRTYRTLPNTIVKYNLLDETGIKNLSKLIQQTLLELRKNGAALASTIASRATNAFINEDFKSLFHFLVDNTNPVVPLEKIEQIVNEFNNGSHHLEAVASFLTGFKNIPENEQPRDDDNHIKYAPDGILFGFSQLPNADELRKWVHFDGNQERNYVKPAPTTTA